MSVSLVDRVFNHSTPCYSNEIHHAKIMDTVEKSYERTTAAFANELVKDYYLSRCQESIDRAAVDESKLRQTGTHLLKVIRQRAVARLSNAA